MVEADIDAFFDNVDHGILMEKTFKHLQDSGGSALLARWIKAEIWDGNRLHSVEKGIPQGSALSPNRMPNRRS